MANSPMLLVTTLVVLAVRTWAQPTIPNAFCAQVTTYGEGYQSSSEVYVNYDVDMVLMVTDLGITGSAGKSYVYFLGSGEYGTTYRYLKAFDLCDAMEIRYYSFPQLNKLQNGTYLRSHSFMGRQVDVWQYTINGTYTETMQFAVLSTDYQTPVYLIMDNYIYGSSPIIINSFSGTPPSSSMLTIPDQCLMAKRKQGKMVTAKKRKFFNNHDITRMKYF